MPGASGRGAASCLQVDTTVEALLGGVSDTELSQNAALRAPTPCQHVAAVPREQIPGAAAIANIYVGIACVRVVPGVHANNREVCLDATPPQLVYKQRRENIIWRVPQNEGRKHPSSPSARHSCGCRDLHRGHGARGQLRPSK